MAAPRLFCFGYGYVAGALARGLAAEGWRIAGTTRSEAKAGALRAAGIEAFVVDRGRPLGDPAAALAGTTHLLNSVPPDAAGDPVLADHGDAIAALGDLVWAGQLSTPAVYGDHGGAWVDETTPLRPSGERGRRRLAAEAAWLALWREHGLPVHLFRLAGIYGPGRSPLEAVRNGTARRIVKPGQVFNRIHVDDIVAVLRASMAAPSPGRAYDVADGHPAPPEEVVAYAARLLGRPPPPAIAFETAELSAMARSFYADNKRLRAERIRSELGVTLRYPDYRAGLAALARQQAPSGSRSDGII